MRILVSLLLLATLSGCVIAPDPGYHQWGYYHWHDWQ